MRANAKCELGIVFNPWQTPDFTRLRRAGSHGPLKQREKPSCLNDPRSLSFPYQKPDVAGFQYATEQMNDQASTSVGRIDRCNHARSARDGAGEPQQAQVVLG